MKQEHITSITQLAKTIQGEGFNLGEPVLLIRFSGCNLSCPFCDTKHSLNMSKELSSTLKFGIIHYTLDDTYKIDHVIEFIKKEIGSIQTLMITGGEPFMPNNYHYITEILSGLNLKGINVEIESNGTLITRPSIFKLVNIVGLKHLNINIAPKIEEECYYGDPNITDILTPIINRLKGLEYKLDKKVFKYKMLFKQEYIDNPSFYDILSMLHRDEVCIMPLTKNPKLFDSFENFLDDYHEKCMKTLEFCIQNGHRFSPREHLFLFKYDETEKINVW